MADHGYGSFEFGNSYHQNPQTSTTIVQNRQQYMSNGGPCAETYDPSRNVDSLRQSTYNPTTMNGFNNGGGPTHQTFLASGAGGSGLMNGAFGDLQGIPDFEPLQMMGGGGERMRQQQQRLSPLQQQAIENELLLRRQASQHLSAVMPDPFGQGSSNFIKPAAILSRPPGPSPASKPKPPSPPERWLLEIEVKVPGLSLEPMHGPDVLKRVEQRTHEVVCRYLPCVDFLVSCQQELRRGLAVATQKKLVHRTFRDAMTPRQFYNSYIADLPRKFSRKNTKLMKTDDLQSAIKELQKLCSNAKAVEHQGCEVVKNTFLGGMKDGESWGLRKWLSKHGGALHICNDSEQLLNACQKLDRNKQSTIKLSKKLRPLAQTVLKKLKKEVPASYQEQSSAHPYLPFFHRLESCLRGMSSFDPEDDDVICLDSDDDEVVEVKKIPSPKPPPPSSRPKSRKRKNDSSSSNSKPATKKRSVGPTATAAAAGVEAGGVIELLDSASKASAAAAAASASSSPGPSSSPARTPVPTGAGYSAANSETDDARYMQELLKAFDSDADGHDDVFAGLDVKFDDDDGVDLLVGGSSSASAAGAAALAGEETDTRDSLDLASDIELLASMFDSGQHILVRPDHFLESTFWDDGPQYATALRLFSEILRTPDSNAYLDCLDDDYYTGLGQLPYTAVIKNPLSFRDIVNALIANSSNGGDFDQVTGSDGSLPAHGLSTWNMWRGLDLLQAIDLVFLNSLAYGKAAEQGRSPARSNANKLRKLFWAGIKRVLDSNLSPEQVEFRRKNTPTRRGESSGFVVYKDK